MELNLRATGRHRHLPHGITQLPPDTSKCTTLTQSGRPLLFCSWCCSYSEGC